MRRIYGSFVRRGSHREKEHRSALDGATEEPVAGPLAPPESGQPARKAKGQDKTQGSGTNRPASATRLTRPHCAPEGPAAGAKKPAGSMKGIGFQNAGRALPGAARADQVHSWVPWTTSTPNLPSSMETRSSTFRYGQSGLALTMQVLRWIRSGLISESFMA